MNASSKRFLIPVLIGLLILLGGGLYSILGSGRIGRLQALPVAAYLENPENLRGNRYSFDAWIEGQLVWREDVGRLLEVRPADETSRVAVYVPAELDQNLYVGQRYLLDVRIQRGGLIHVRTLEKY